MAYSSDISRTRNGSFEGWQRGAHVRGRAGLFGGIRQQIRRRLSISHVLLFALAALSFRLFLFFDMGGVAYGAKMQALADGNMMEQVASVAMRMDPVSEWVIRGVRFGTW